MAAPTTTYRMWKRLAERPGGTRLFSAAMVRVPYFASIVPRVVRMERLRRGHGAQVVLREGCRYFVTLRARHPTRY